MSEFNWIKEMYNKTSPLVRDFITIVWYLAYEFPEEDAYKDIKDATENKNLYKFTNEQFLNDFKIRGAEFEHINENYYLSRNFYKLRGYYMANNYNRNDILVARNYLKCAYLYIIEKYPDYENATELIILTYSKKSLSTKSNSGAIFPHFFYDEDFKKFMH